MRLPQRMAMTWAGSFNSRQSTISTITGNGDSISVATTETEVDHASAIEVDAIPYRLRRSRTRWLEDYELNAGASQKNGDSAKPKLNRVPCLIRCSPEKVRGFINATSREATIHRPSEIPRNHRPSKPLFVLGKKNCERCWHNPETPPCDLCMSALTADQPRPVLIHAVVERNAQPQSSVCVWLSSVYSIHVLMQCFAFTLFSPLFCSSLPIPAII